IWQVLLSSRSEDFLEDPVGFMRGYNQHWIKESNSLSVLWILAKTDTKCPSPGATPPQSPSSSIDDNESSDNITAGSDYEETLKSSEQIRRRNSKGKQKQFD
ncbi:12849_t:CDS:2, partial [Funneliformis caledonium]